MSPKELEELGKRVNRGKFLTEQISTLEEAINYNNELSTNPQAESVVGTVVETNLRCQGLDSYRIFEVVKTAIIKEQQKLLADAKKELQDL